MSLAELFYTKHPRRSVRPPGKKALRRPSGGEIYGSEEDDRLTIDASAAGTVGVTFAGNAGTDTLVGPDTDSAWTITGFDAGVVGSVAFGGGEDLRGGAARDLFAFTGLGRVSRGVSGGVDHDRAQGADQGNTWRISGQNAGALNAESLSE